MYEYEIVFAPSASLPWEVYIKQDYFLIGSFRDKEAAEEWVNYLLSKENDQTKYLYGFSRAEIFQ